MKLFSCICSECGKWHSHCYPHPRKKLKFICVNCLNKKGVENVKKN